MQVGAAPLYEDMRARCAAGGPFDWYEQGPVGFVVAGSVRLDASSRVAVTPPR